MKIFLSILLSLVPVMGFAGWPGSLDEDALKSIRATGRVSLSDEKTIYLKTEGDFPEWVTDEKVAFFSRGGVCGVFKLVGTLYLDNEPINIEHTNEDPPKWEWGLYMIMEENRRHYFFVANDEKATISDDIRRTALEGFTPNGTPMMTAQDGPDGQD